jgi:hypothetical protein
MFETDPEAALQITVDRLRVWARQEVSRAMWKAGWRGGDIAKDVLGKFLIDLGRGKFERFDPAVGDLKTYVRFAFRWISERMQSS